jgi:hypothetical protein
MQELRDIAKHKLYMAEIRLDPALGLRRAKAAAAKRKRELLDPNWGDIRKFPSATSVSLQSTKLYIWTYEELNHDTRRLTRPTFVNCNGRPLW